MHSCSFGMAAVAMEKRPVRSTNPTGRQYLAVLVVTVRKKHAP